MDVEWNADSQLFEDRIGDAVVGIEPIAIRETPEALDAVISIPDTYSEWTKIVDSIRNAQPFKRWGKSDAARYNWCWRSGVEPLECAAKPTEELGDPIDTVYLSVDEAA